MPESSSFGFGQYVPGFDFLQTLAESAAKGMPRAAPAGMPDWAGWVAPTLQPEELDKRIKELKTVQFWLEQNARALAATIQALEVQKMSLATLRGMNVQMGDLASAFRFPAADGAAASAAPPAQPASAPRAAGAPGPYDDMFTAGTGSAAHRTAPKPEPANAAASEQAAPSAPAPASASAAQTDAARPDDAPQAATGIPGTAGVADPLQWWNALTEQFQQIAAAAIQDAARQPPVIAATAPLADAARQAFDAATRMASGVATATGAGAAPATVRKAPSPATKTAVPRKAAARAPQAPAPRSGATPAPRSVVRPSAPAASSAAPRPTRKR